MKKIKRVFNYILLVILSLFLIGCTEINDYSDLRNALNDTIESIQLKYDLDNVTNDLEFVGANNNYSYKFISSDETVISSTGEVNRQFTLVEVVITVRVYQDEMFLQGTFKCKVIPIEVNQDLIDLQLALDNTINSIESKYDLNNIKSDIELVGLNDKYEYIFTSSNITVITNDGKVTRLDTDTVVTITIKIVYNEYSLQDYIEVTVKALVVNDGYTYDVVNTKSKLKVSELNQVTEDGEYNNYLDVVAYIYYYHKLPKNFLTKSQAKNLGWKGSGNVWVNNNLKGKNIGGDVFNNYEGILPVLSNKPYIEVDVNCSGGSRGKYRIVYNKYTFDIYYTDDHYESFTYMIGMLGD